MIFNRRAIRLEYIPYTNAVSGPGLEGAALQRALRNRPDLVDGMRRELGLHDGGAGGGEAAPLHDLTPVAVRQTPHSRGARISSGPRLRVLM